MGKYKVIWFIGEPKNVLSEWVVEAENRRDASYIGITKLPKEEQEKYKVNIQYCVRMTLPEESDEAYVDYGSHSKFLWVSSK